MFYKKQIALIAAGLCAGAVNGLFGGGGGMLLVPILTGAKVLPDDQIFSASVAIILPICIVSLLLCEAVDILPLLPYLAGSFFGGLGAGLWGKNIPVLWLHKGLGVLILWGGIRYLCNG